MSKSNSKSTAEQEERELKWLTSGNKIMRESESKCFIAIKPPKGQELGKPHQKWNEMEKEAEDTKLFSEKVQNGGAGVNQPIHSESNGR